MNWESRLEGRERRYLTCDAESREDLADRLSLAGLRFTASYDRSELRRQRARNVIYCIESRLAARSASPRDPELDGVCLGCGRPVRRHQTLSPEERERRYRYVEFGI